MCTMLCVIMCTIFLIRKCKFCDFVLSNQYEHISLRRRKTVEKDHRYIFPEQKKQKSESPNIVLLMVYHGIVYLSE